MSESPEVIVRSSLERLATSINEVQASESLVASLVNVASDLVDCIRRGGTVLLCGNGGSAADAQHLAAEFVGRQNFDRPPASALALTTDTSALTAIGNDYDFSDIFARQVRAIGRPADLLIGISTSGRSPNVLKALAVARGLGMETIGFTGPYCSEMAPLVDRLLSAPADATSTIQELHITFGHIVFGIAEERLFRVSSAPQGE